MSVEDVCDIAYAVLVERVEGDARAQQINAEDARVRLDQALAAEPVAAHLSDEQVELRRALGVL